MENNLETMSYIFSRNPTMATNSSINIDSANDKINKYPATYPCMNFQINILQQYTSLFGMLISTFFFRQSINLRFILIELKKEVYFPLVNLIRPVLLSMIESRSVYILANGDKSMQPAMHLKL